MKLVKDPVCGMEIKKEENAGSVEYKNIVYYFCSYGCRKRFEENPERYIDTNDHGQEEHHIG